MEVYFDAIARTGYIIARVALMIGLATVLTTTTKPLDLTLGLESLMSPLKKIKINVHVFAMMISIALRFIPTLLEETDKIMKAQASRGLDIENGKLRDKIRGLIALIIPLLVSSFHMASDLANAMEVRGYDPSAKRTRYHVLRFKTKDIFAILVTSAFATAGVLINIGVIDINQWLV